MIDCLPNTTETKCLHCGWVKPEKIKGWPRRNCGIQPDLGTPLQPAVDDDGDTYVGGSGLCVYCQQTFTSRKAHREHECLVSADMKRLDLSHQEYRQLSNPQLGTPAEQLEKAKAGAERLGVTWADAIHFAAALARWGKAGFPVREQAEVERIEREICRSCEAYRDGRCGKCGCRVTASSLAVMNKIKMATETCPLGKWL